MATMGYGGYGGMSGPQYPLMGVNNGAVNTTSGSYSGNFSSRATGSQFAAAEPRSNIEAASGTWTGGKKRRRRRNGTRKMTTQRRKRKGVRRTMRGGSHGFGSTTASIAGKYLPPQLSAMANPPPFYKLSSSTNCSVGRH